MSDQPTTCPKCSKSLPAAARFCSACGTSVAASGGARPYAAAPNESVASIALVTTVMPYASARSPQTYKLALLFGMLIPIAALFMNMPAFAFAAAAYVVPMVFIVYLYDVNLWEDQPIPIVIATFVLGGALGLGFTWLWESFLTTQGNGIWIMASGDFDTLRFVTICIAVPIIAVILMMIGPMILASRPRFDDLMDGLTFGIVSAVAYSALETIVMNWGMVSGSAEVGDTAAWIAVIVNMALIKPIVYGCAVGIAVAEFSGLGEGHDGFSGRFVVRAIEAMVAIILFQGGLYLTGLLGGTNGTLLGLAWALLIVAILILRVRTVLQRALLEGALEAAARGGSSKWSSGADDFCAECEMPLPVDAMFCVACGASVRARSKGARAASEAGTSGERGMA